MTTIPKTSNPLRVVLSRIGEPSLAHYGAARTPLNEPQEAAKFWRDIVSPEPSFEADKEHLVAVLVDTKLRPTGYHIISVGSLNEAIAHPREIMRAAVVASAYGLVLMHNHPSGDPAASEADHRVTRRVSEAADILQIRFLDHVIIGDSTHFSFREGGLL
ncbi:MAG TPA: JAB domain-containing protein [Chthoniobacterales bacterium]